MTLAALQAKDAELEALVASEGDAKAEAMKAAFDLEAARDVRVRGWGDGGDWGY